jgi:H2-forming N5,N10-methylenetetrahydromethanopterin dehydrogenase-like enzyme
MKYWVKMKFLKYSMIVVVLVFFNIIKAPIGALLDSSLVPVTLCDKAYAVSMQQALDALRNYSKVDLLNTAEQYMIMLKQHQDLDYAIRQIENNVFDSTIVAMLRRPLEEYARCKTDIRSGTVTRTRDL